MYVGQLRAAGLAKESAVGTLVTPPTEYIPYIAPDSFIPAIALLESTAIRSLPDRVYLASQGPGDVKGLKVKWEASPENIGNLLMAAFGTDTLTESTSYIITTGTNDKINFKESGGAERTATLAAGTYAMGSSSAVNGSLCKAIKTAMDAATGAAITYTVAFNSGTSKITITPSSGTLQILWLTGTNQATSAWSVLGFTHVDTADGATVTSNGTTTVQAWAHTFTRLAAAQLPSYSWWFDKGAKYPQFVGCMVNKLDFMVKAREFVQVDSEWVGMAYDDNGTSKTPSYNAIKPFKFDQCVVSVDGSQINNYDNVKVTLDNIVKADHVLRGSIWPGKVYSEGFEVTISMDLFVEDSTQYNKFLAGTSCALNFVLTHATDVTGAASGKKFALTVDIPTAMYSVASYPNAPGIIKIAFTARGIYTTASTKTVSIALVNSVSAAY